MFTLYLALNENSWTVASSWDVSRVAVADLLAPVKDVVDILDEVAQLHPAVKVRSF